VIPLHDDNPTTIRPLVTYAVIGLAVLVFLWQLTLPERAAEGAYYALGLVPAVLFGTAKLPAELAWVPPEATVITSMFMHGGLLHIGGNMLYLWIFGNNVEDAMGHIRFVAFYLLCGVAAALAQAFQDPSSTVPMVGASGAIGGVLGAYLLLYPRARILVFVPLGFFSQMLRVPAYVVLGLWIVLQLISSAQPTAAGGGVAYWAHIGGFLAGLVLILAFRRPGVALLDRGRAAGPWRQGGSGRPRRGSWG